jgi:hypothetical protein
MAFLSQYFSYSTSDVEKTDEVTTPSLQLEKEGVYSEDHPIQVYGSACCFNGAYNDYRNGIRLGYDDAKLIGVTHCVICGLELWSTYEAAYGLGAMSSTVNTINTVDPRVLRLVLPKYQSHEKANQTADEFALRGTLLPSKPVSDDVRIAYNARLDILKKMTDSDPLVMTQGRAEYMGVVKKQQDKKLIEDELADVEREKYIIGEIKKIQDYIISENPISVTKGSFKMSFVQIPQDAVEIEFRLGSSILSGLERMAYHAMQDNQTYWVHINSLTIIIDPGVAGLIVNDNAKIELEDLFKFKQDTGMTIFSPDSARYGSIRHKSEILMGIQLQYPEE